jgi:homoserine O-acetyltransferase
MSRTGEIDMKASCATLSAILLSVSLSAIATSALAADYPAPKQGDWIARDFKFHTGETLPELKPLQYCG